MSTYKARTAGVLSQHNLDCVRCVAATGLLHPPAMTDVVTHCQSAQGMFHSIQVRLTAAPCRTGKQLRM